MDTKPDNPLSKHFRRPAIYFKLPSNGKFWEEGSIDLPVTSEIPVYPMTAGDEITLKTPDALMNGSGIVSVIQSCCPNIKDAWKMPSVDVDATLIAIRIASYGAEMTVTSKCPKCNEEHDYDVDLGIINNGVVCPNFNNPILYDGLKIKLKPQQYFSVTQTNVTQFEEQKIAQALTDPNIDDDIRNAKLKASMQKILELNDRLLIESTEYIETEDGTKITNTDHLLEFYKNAPSAVTKSIEERLADIAKQGALPLVSLNCSACSESYQVPLEFDYASFFEIGS